MFRVGRRTRTQSAVLGLAYALLATASLGQIAHAKGSAPSSGAPSQPATASPAQAAAPEPATASSVGLLPVHAISVDLSALPGVGDKGKGKGEEVAALQQLWDSYLKGAGFNVIEFAVDVRDLGDGGAGRVAKLCGWAKQNNVRIAPTLMGAVEGQPLPADYPNLAASFVGKVIATLGAAGISGYSQIVFYQLDRPLNHPVNHGPMEADAAAALLKAAAENVRAAEQAGLAASGMQPTPLMVPSSFDYELIRRGAIAKTAISDESYTQAYESLKDYLLTVFGSAPVEAASVEWFPGSLSSDGVDRFPDLINRLEADLPGKLLIVDTGYSSAAGSDTLQARYYQVALNNLCDLRANQGVDSPFAGILWRSAIDGGTAQAAAAAQPSAGDVTKMWNNPKAESREARSWFKGVQSHFGLLARARENSTGLAPKTAYRIMSGLESALSQSPQASDALAAVKELAAAGKTGGMGQAVKARLQTAVFGMLDAWLSKSAENLFTSPTESAPAQAPGLQPQPPDVQIFVDNPIPESVIAGTRVLVPVTLVNVGGGQATDAVVYLRYGEHLDLVHTNPLSLSPGGQTMVELAWTPGAAGVVQGITAEVFCSNDADPSSNRFELGNLKVDPGKKPPRPFDLSGVRATLGSRTLMQSSSSPSTNPPAPGGSGGGGPKIMMATSSGSGFASIEGLSAPQMMMAPLPGTPAPTTSARTVTGSPSPTSAPAREPVTMTLANPFRTVFRNAVATLRVDDAIVSTRPLGSLLPGQRRTVAFTEWSPPHPGSYRLRADLDGVGLTGNHLTSSASSTITVAGDGGVARITPMPGDPARSIVHTRALTPLMGSGSSQPVRTLGGQTRGFGEHRGVRSFAGNRPLSLTANNILLRPFPRAAGAPVAISVQLSNLEIAPVVGARVAVSIDGTALGETVTDIPATGSVVASGFKEWTAQPGRHTVQASVVVGSNRSEATKFLYVMPAGTRGFGRPGFVAGGGFGHAGDRKGAAQPGLEGKSGSGFQPGFMPMIEAGRLGGAADLQITATDIRFAPALPSVGAAMNVTITVHNIGAAPASDGRVLAVLSAGGVEVARRQFIASVPASGTLALAWPLTTPSGSPILVTATATVTGDANLANNQARATATGRIPVKGIISPATIGSERKGSVTP